NLPHPEERPEGARLEGRNIASAAIHSRAPSSAKQVREHEHFFSSLLGCYARNESEPDSRMLPEIVIAGLVPAIHGAAARWMPVSSTGMTFNRGQTLGSDR
ncbi:MAG: hypothetical protein WEC41_01380, partial [Dongiaceae bacterium]